MIVEHEPMHIDGEFSDRNIWKRMRGRCNPSSLNLMNNSKIFSFCHIKKRFSVIWSIE